MFWTCSSFLSSFSLTVFINFFLIQKSKSSTNLNPKEEKQEEATIDYSTTISDLSGINVSGVIHPWDNFPRGGGRGAVFLGANSPRGNYAGDKSSERQFSLGAIVQGEIVSGQYSSRMSSEGQLSGVGQFSSGGYCPGGNNPGRGGGNHPGGNCPGGNFPREQLSGHLI